LPGRDPGIHALNAETAEAREGVDGRVKPGQGDLTGQPWNKPGQGDLTGQPWNKPGQGNLTGQPWNTPGQGDLWLYRDGYKEPISVERTALGLTRPPTPLAVPKKDVDARIKSAQRRLDLVGHRLRTRFA
jgi:hypothetical protein